MKILILDQFSEPGGAQLNLLELLPEFQRRDWQVEVALPGNGALVSRLRASGVPVHPLRLSRYSLGSKGLQDALRFVTDLPALAARIRELSAGSDVVYVNGPRLLPAVACARLKVPVVFHAHNRVNASAGGMLVRWAAARSGAMVIAASRFVASGYGRARVIYSGVRGPDRPRPEAPSGQALRVGMIGRIGPQKQQMEFVQAAAMLPDSRFLLCGDSMFGDPVAQSYKQRVLASAPENVEYTGWQDDVQEVLSRLDLLVVPSAGEGGVPRVALEAFAAGVPVLARASGAVPEVIVEGHNGFLLPGGSAPEIALRIHDLGSRRPRLAQVAAEARRQWEAQFQPGRFQRDVCSAIQDCCSPSLAPSLAGAIHQD